MSKQTDLINIPDAITVSGAVVTESASAGTVEHTINNETSSGNRYSMLTFKDQGTNKYYQYQNHNDGNVLFRNEHATGSLQFMTGGANERLRIDSSGRVTTPYQPAFWAFSSTYATTGNYPFTNFNISGAGKFNTGNHLNLTSGVFTAPLAGRYQFNGSFHSTSASTTARRIGRFQLNGNSLGEFAESSAQYADIGASIIVNMSANDTMQIITHPWYFDEVDFSGYLIG